MKKKSILILDGFCKQSLPFIRGFKELGCEVSVVCSSKLDCAYSSRLPDHKILISCDLRNPTDSEPILLSIIKNGTYDLVIPLFDGTVRIMADHKYELSMFTTVYVNDRNVFEAAYDKENVMRVCSLEGLPHPHTAFDINSISDIESKGLSYPIIIKPKRLYGARGFHIFNDKNDLVNYVSSRKINLSEYVVQEYIPSGSRVIGGNVFIDRDGNIKSSYLYICEHLYPEDGGTSTLNAILQRDDILATCEKLVKVMNLRGLVGVDLMIDRRDNKGKVIEINVRPVHGITLGFISGVNHAKQIYQDAFGLEVEKMKIDRFDIGLRILQTDVLWFLSSPDRFRRSGIKLGYTIKEQMFFWDDPLPWFSFLLGGLKDYRKKMLEKKQ